jgi:predicted enzyme related to lactoylglutathione lyase
MVTKHSGASVMRRLTKMALAASAGLLLTGFAHADAKMFAARVASSDVEGLVKFYESAFGLKQVQRVEAPNLLEIMMNFGDTVDAAKANPAPRIIVMRAPNAAADTVAHLLLNVTDMDAAMAAVKAAGGSVPGKPIEFGQAKVLITFAADPAGNQIEMIQLPKR